MNKRTIAFVTGGYSGESVISYKSAVTIENNIDQEKYTVYKIDIHPTGWWYETNEGEEVPVDKNDFSVTIDGRKITFEAVLIGIHGTPGEDGKLQGYLDMLNLPYTSCDVTASAITFNKRFTTSIAGVSGIKVAKSFHYYKGDPINIDQLARELGFPVFVKPANGGSSIGMSKVPEIDGLEMAIEKAFKEDEQVLVEEFIKGREFTIGVLKRNGQIVTLPITEVISKKDFFDYEAK